MSGFRFNPLELSEEHIARFHEGYTKTDGCWVWHDQLLARGYGFIKSKGRRYLAHRISYLVHYGADPAGLMVCHRCDNPPCVNPDHLFLGTHSDNCEDRLRKGRFLQRRGSLNPTAKLNEAQVFAIRASRKTTAQLAREHGVAYSTIHSARSGVTWSHLP